MNASVKLWLNKFNIFIFPILVISMGTFILLDNLNLFYDEEAVMYTYLDSAAQGKLGYGFDVQYYNDISFAGLEIGDIVVGGYPDCAYGKFSHAGIYIGNGQVIEAFADYGVHIHSIDHYRDYTQVCLLRVDVDSVLKNNAVQYARNFQGKMFYPLALKPGDRIWNCSKIIWKAYYEQGVDLDTRGDLWISPDTFYYSSNVSIIREKGK